MPMEEEGGGGGGGGGGGDINMAWNMLKRISESQIKTAWILTNGNSICSA